MLALGQDSDPPALPVGLTVTLTLLATLGDPHYIGLNGIALCAAPPPPPATLHAPAPRSPRASPARTDAGEGAGWGGQARRGRGGGAAASGAGVGGAVWCQRYRVGRTRPARRPRLPHRRQARRRSGPLFPCLPCPSPRLPCPCPSPRLPFPVPPLPLAPRQKNRASVRIRQLCEPSYFPSLCEPSLGSFQGTTRRGTPRTCGSRPSRPARQRA